MPGTARMLGCLESAGTTSLTPTLPGSEFDSPGSEFDSTRLSSEGVRLAKLSTDL